VRVSACNDHLELTRQLLSNGCNVHIAMKRVLRELLARAVWGNVEYFCEFQKNSARVVLAIKNIQNFKRQQL